MDAVLSAAKKLADLLRHSPEAGAYRAAKEKLAANPDLKARVEAFQTAHQSLSAGLLYQDRPDIAEERAISGQYAELMLYPAAREYWSAERALLDLVGRVMDTVAGGVEGIIEV